MFFYEMLDSKKRLGEILNVVTFYCNWSGTGHCNSKLSEKFLSFKIHSLILYDISENLREN